ncbi:MAG: hypothetical protein M1820_002166 [Bogoriella megaspora]|nr:MAG: hypothetical protein M1820_002166 [Bogoriella megaspora]
MPSPTSTNSTTSASSPPERTPKGVRRACDCCRKRKVRCDGLEPCGPCRKTALRCAYLQAPKKKGPKGLRSARVLHALREIDESLASPTGSVDMQDWGWGSSESSPTMLAEGDESILPDASFFALNGPTSYPPAEAMLTTATPLTSPQYPSIYEPTSQPGLGAAFSSPEAPSFPFHGAHGAVGVRLPSESFIPYVQLFFEHLYPIMPVLDREYWLESGVLSSHTALPSEQYLLLCSLSAATIVQLDAASQAPQVGGNYGDSEAAAQVFAKECLRERHNVEYVDNPTELTVMTSFFLFAYFGNLEKSEKAWYYLQETISFAQVMELDNESKMATLEPMESLWRRRQFWLLFVTEKAYAIQRRRRTRLQPTIELPVVYPPEEAHLVSGFVSLVTLFSTVTDDFLNVWLGARRVSICSSDWLTETQRTIDATALAAAQGNISETQQIDINISRQWLHVLAWQMGVSNGLVWRPQDPELSLEYPVNLAKDVVSIIRSARRDAVDSHGIGMEQKLTDIAGCLTDVLKCTAVDPSDTFFRGQDYLSTIMQQLSRIRGKESRYLRPLISKTDGLLGYSLIPGPSAQSNVVGQPLRIDKIRDEDIPDPANYYGITAA